MTREPITMLNPEWRVLWLDFTRGWRPMLVIHGSVLLAIAVFLGPLTVGIVRGLVRFSGERAVSDTAIAGFLFSPVGALAGLVIGSLALTLGLLGYAALLLAARQTCHGTGISVSVALARIGSRLPALLRLAGRFIIRMLLAVLPFAGGISLVYLLLLGEHDINFYLAEKPPVFRIAAGLAALISLGMAWVLVRVTCDWFHALPLVLFSTRTPSEVCKESPRAAAGQRGEIAFSIVLWLVGTPLLTGLLTLPVAGLGRWLVPALSDRLGLLAPVLGLLLLAAAAASFAGGFITTSLLAIRHMRLFERSHPTDSPGPASPPSQGAGRCTGIGFIAASLLIISLTSWATYRWLGRLVVEDQVVVIAHRGASAAAPENTLAAVRVAIEQGADWVEIDVQVNAVGEVLVFHDRDFMRVGKHALDLRDARPEDLAAIDIGSWFDPGFSTERTPTLREVLDTCRGRCGVLIELKHYGGDDHLEQQMVEEVERAGMVDDVQVMSLDHAAVRRMRVLRPEWPVGLLSSVALGDLTRLDVDFLGLNGKAATPSLIRRAREAGIDVYVWTINDAVGMSAMISRGADGLITDEPGRARTVIAQRSSLNPSARLLLELASRLGGPTAIPAEP